ncbi:MAG: AraC family transcriptional regulator [Turicibacter sp.]|nr:AraC family transcriptional regulator [Turicibacter sp.]
MYCFKPKADYSRLDFMLYHCGSSDCEKNQSWGPGIRDYYSLYYVTEGSGYLTIDGQDYTIVEGTCFLVPPHVVISYKPDLLNPWSYHFIGFNGDTADDYLERIGLSTSSPISSCENEKKIEECFEYILSSVNHPKSADLQAISGFYALIGTLCDHTEPPVPKIQTTSRQADYIRQAIEYIETNYSRQITVEEISNHVGINRKYLTKLFNEKINNSPKNYLIQYRINKACRLLKQSTLSIQEVSHSVGYTDALVFSKIFKKVVGTCPREYRSAHFMLNQ